MVQMFEVGDVVQFTENHDWCGCLGIVEEVQPTAKAGCMHTDYKYMVGVPVPHCGTAYIYTKQSDGDISYIGHAVMMPGDDEAEDEEGKDNG